MPLDDKPGSPAVHFLRGWALPVGGIILTTAGCYAVLVFPLGGVWPRMFGQGVTLRGPTHLVLAAHRPFGWACSSRRPHRSM